ncbi:MAG TPA: glycosyltransferase family 87 protein [Anaerolineae bacterium]|nr:glycosyltransferase family 87 protein [Anaerolineae bacterium]
MKNRWQVMRIGVVVLVAWFVLTAGVYLAFTSRFNIAVWDFHPPWLALRAMLHAGVDPYSEPVTQLIQSQMLGQTAAPGEDQYAFVYPLYLMVIVGPLSLLPLPAAQAIWLALLMLCVVVIAFIGSRTIGWHPPAGLLGLTAFFAVGLYQNVWAVILGQVSLVAAALIVLAWWSVRNEHWQLAGVCLALATIKPQVSFLFVPVLLAWGIYRKRWALVSSFAVMLAVLILAPMLWLPRWPLEWLEALGRYAGYTFFDPPLVALTGSPALAGLFAAALMAGVVWQWRRAADRDGRALDWALAAALVLSALIAPRTTQANQAALLLPLFLVFARISRNDLVAAIELGLLVGIWLLDFAAAPELNTAEHRVWQHQIVNPILPLALALALALLRPRMPREVSRA